MATTTSWSDLHLDDSPSSTGTFLSASTVPGPGAIAGKFLKTLGERSLDFFVIIIIRRRLGAIGRTLQKSPEVMRNPTGEKEWKIMIGAYKDLHEICRESRSHYYPLSLQRAAANLIRDITIITRPEHNTFIDGSPTNEKWEELLARVQLREELISMLPTTIVLGPGRQDSSSFQPGLLKSPVKRSGTNFGAKIEVNRSNAQPAGDLHNRKVSSFFDWIFRTLVLDTSPNDLIRKVVVLGAGGVGKSTLVKQIMASLGGPFSQETGLYHDIIINNMWESMRNILSNLDVSEISLTSRDPFQLVVNNKHNVCHPTSDCIICHSMGDAISILWQDPVIRLFVRKLKLGMLPKLDVDPTADYFFDSVLRISQPDYKPTPKDVVHCRVRTPGIRNYEFRVDKDSPWLVIDTRGGRPELREWVNCFENVTAVVFVVALSDYNKTLDEDHEMNCIEDSLRIFKSLIRSRWLTTALMILLFNKTDLFAEKLENIPLTDYFPDYTGNDFVDACEYFEKRFLSLFGDKIRPVVVKYGCAINAEATRGTFWSIKDECPLRGDGKWPSTLLDCYGYADDKATDVVWKDLKFNEWTHIPGIIGGN